MDYYTLAIEFIPVDKGGRCAIQFTDMTRPAQHDNDTAWSQSIMENIYIAGVSYQTAPGTRELVSPGRIRTAYLIKQPAKIAT